MSPTYLPFSLLILLELRPSFYLESFSSDIDTQAEFLSLRNHRDELSVSVCQKTYLCSFSFFHIRTFLPRLTVFDLCAHWHHHSTVLQLPSLLFLWRWSVIFLWLLLKFSFCFLFFCTITLCLVAEDLILFSFLGLNLIRNHWTSWICRLLFSITFLKFSAIISSYIAYAPFYFFYKSLIKYMLDLLSVHFMFLTLSSIFFAFFSLSLDHKYFCSSIFCSLRLSPNCTLLNFTFQLYILKILLLKHPLNFTFQLYILKILSIFSKCYSFLFLSIYSLPLILLNIVTMVVLQFTSDSSSNRSLFLLFAVFASLYLWKSSLLVCLFMFGYMVNTAFEKLFVGTIWVLHEDMFLQKWCVMCIWFFQVHGLCLVQGRTAKTWNSLKPQRIATCL